MKMNSPSVQDRHLDVLLSMALEQLEREENEKLVMSADPQLETASALRLDRAYASAYETASREKRRVRRRIRGRKAVRGLRVAFAALAVMIVLALAAFPVALAASAEFRDRVMKLFMDIDERYGSGRFVISTREDADDSAPPDLPDYWDGSYYPRYIPEGFTRTDYDAERLTAVYTSPSGQRFTFSENMGSMPPVDPPEGSFYILKYIQGGDFPVIEEQLEGGGSRITITWEAESRWFRLVTENMERDEALKIADGTALYSKAKWLIQEEESSPPGPTIVGVPDWWQGAWYPSYLPEGMWIESFDVKRNVTYRGEENKEIEYTEWSGEVEGNGYFSYMTEVTSRPVSINGAAGALIRSDEAGMLLLNLTWETPEAAFMLHTCMISEEEAIRVAESVIPCGEDRAPNASISRDEQGIALPPQEWTGRYFPDFVPEGLCLVCMNRTSFQLSDGQGNQSLYFDETLILSPHLPSLHFVDSVRLIDVGGRKGVLISQLTPEGALHSLSLDWEIEDSMWITLKSHGLTEETLVEIAKSVRRLTPSPQTKEYW